MSIEKIKISQKDFDELYEIDKSTETKEETVLNEEEQAHDDAIEEMEDMF